MTPPLGVAPAGHRYSSSMTTSPSARTGYHFMPKPDVFGFIAPSWRIERDGGAPSADSHLSNEASEPAGGAVEGTRTPAPAARRVLGVRGGRETESVPVPRAQPTRLRRAWSVRWSMGPPSQFGGLAAACRIVGKHTRFACQ